MEMIETECQICGGSAELRHKEFPGYQDPDTFKIYHCSFCNTSFSLPKVETTSIYENIYKNGNRVPGYSRYWRYAQIIKKFANPLDFLAETKDTYWGVKEALLLSGEDSGSKKILEVGSGLGYLTYSLRKANYDASGLDISKTAVKHANETFGDHYICADLFEYARLQPETFDIVILTEVIEHVDNPLDFIKSIIKLLKPDGRAIITTLNKTFYPADTIWATDLPPVHYWWLSEESMSSIAKTLNLKISFINFSGFYRKNYEIVDLRSHLGGKLPGPYFNKEGELIVKVGSTNKLVKLYIRLLVDKLPYANNIYINLKGFALRTFGKLRTFLSKDIIVCGERGIVICAVMQKS
jgi:SAM-dependent methyltransferase